ncbi:MAG: hypothetical protein CM15mP120_13130 [Pseudomonadota bacterium]|nr:MAG: hypothetical protein CM15mP120_13130 [Pseudomonadota bacterium]
MAKNDAIRSRGNYGALGFGGVISGPLSSDVGLRLSAQQYSDDGFIENQYLRRDDTDNHDETTLRLSSMAETMSWIGSSAPV